MGQWPYIIACYAVTLGGAVALSVASLISMRRAEKRAEEVGKSRP